MLSSSSEFNSPATQAFLTEERHPRLSFAEEVDLTTRFKNSLLVRDQIKELTQNDSPIDTELYAMVNDGIVAMDTIARANRGLVVSIAKKYMGQGVPFLDLVQEGNLGLMDAAADFQPERKNRLSTFATKNIQWSIRRAVDEQGRTISVPVNFQEKMRDAKPVEDALIQELGRFPYDQELIDHLPQNWQSDFYTLFFQFRQPERSIHEKVGVNQEAELEDFIPALETGYEEIDQDDLSDFIAQFTPDDMARVMLAVHSLPSEQAEVLLWQFGFKDGEDHKDEDLATMFQTTKKAIQAKRFRAMNSLRKVLIEK